MFSWYLDHPSTSQMAEIHGVSTSTSGWPLPFGSMDGPYSPCKTPPNIPWFPLKFMVWTLNFLFWNGSFEDTLIFGEVILPPRVNKGRGFCVMLSWYFFCGLTIKKKVPEPFPAMFFHRIYNCYLSKCAGSFRLGTWYMRKAYQWKIWKNSWSNENEHEKMIPSRVTVF